ncbi:TPA: hypothetical protein DIU27_05735 [Candidatus Collierbacteria bacterium]|uniref:Toxic anion resistance family protein n=1 Tax=Candidatus Collierbacteria bacterium GW2011_GWB2_44_22 TaxID=1618387 RepID=A0A0G1K757_9BACT|nr:MAG: hypothetical protein UW31_C0015G0005 [Candidatus Collierbacteria bacterium GW2011_GWA2_44_13]KKT48836.1 MAG: hypothetical protein UW42_C0046G0004 [Candidatus Collierbacteria bacterium GW2011_GWB1_44_197]KKT52137.1 MAG: hypothetical protein UW44_C0004G0042 [Candidatus Collierbacteria bacterium GW2011_GWB2_44_22]KKT61787.1 MAG: hypothetical protein UW56_C0018G0017 [Candidatus Collierbacteria bacterium GW2011_GWD1_44_27]KKT65699.1 MAG: hypothetical protein UW58_C0022G0005 [Candidatus Colli
MTDPIVEGEVLKVDRSVMTTNPDNEQLSAAQKQLVGKIISDFDPLKDPMAITKFGIVQANGISQLADPVLALVRGKNSPQAAAILDNCAKDAKNLDFTQIKKYETQLQLPNGIKKLAQAIDRLKKQVETLDKKMKQAEGLLEKDKNLLTSRANTLFGLLQQSMEMYNQMRCHVFAADAKIAQLNALKSQKTMAASTASDKVMAQQEITALTGVITRLEARKMALKQMGMIAIQQIFSIQTVLSNSVGLLDTVEMNMAAVNTVWKTQVVVALSAYEQHQIAMHQQNFAANLGSLMVQTADQIGMAIESTADAQATGVVTIDALEQSGNKMVENIQAYFAAQTRVEESAKAAGTKIDDIKRNLVNAVKAASMDTKGI